jgi:hypothetical protein
MAVVYYPKNSIMYKRDTISSSYEQVVLSTQPNTILYFGSSSNLEEISGSFLAITASCALTSSYLIGSIESSSFASNTISSSWATSSSYSSVSISSSYSSTASYVSNINSLPSKSFIIAMSISL